MQCLNCGTRFIAVRSTARFCSGACKLKYNRNKGATVTSTGPILQGTIAAPKKDWQDTYGLCAGCKGVNCQEGFIPNKYGSL